MVNISTSKSFVDRVDKVVKDPHASCVLRASGCPLIAPRKVSKVEKIENLAMENAIRPLHNIGDFYRV